MYSLLLDEFQLARFRVPKTEPYIAAGQRGRLAPLRKGFFPT